MGRRRRWQAVGLLALLLVSSLLEGVSIGAIIPVFTALIDPKAFLTSLPVDIGSVPLFDLQQETLRYTLCSIFLVVILLTGIIRTISLWCVNFYTGLVSHDVSVKIFEITIKRPYHEHLTSNSSEVLTGVTHKAGAVSNIVLSLLTIITSLLMIASIFTTLLFISPTLAIFMGISFSAIYFLVAYTVQKSILSNGRKIIENQTTLFRMAQEALGGIKVIILNSSYRMFTRNFARFDLPMRKAQATNKFFYGAPRLILEPLGVALLVTAALMIPHDQTVSTLPILGAIALGAQRLMPALQQCYSAWAAVMGNQAPVVEASRLLGTQESTQSSPIKRKLNLERNLRFVRCTYKLGVEGRVILKDYSLTIEKHSKVGIVGRSGSGKSTFLSLMMGLIQPSEGVVRVDDKELSGPIIPEWQLNIAHVPQEVFLIDGSIADNIAFGVESHSVDLDLMREAIDIADLGDFVTKKEQGIYSKVGERGATISGGERQRIGIARAIYQQREFFVLDEATSALDQETETRIMKNLFEMRPDCTMIIVAHRLDTLRNCDYFIEVSEKNPVIHKCYQDLLRDYLAD